MCGTGKSGSESDGRGIIAAFVVVIVGAGYWAFEGRGQGDPPKKEAAKKPDKKTVKALMGRKLEHSQKLLAALVTNDLKKAGDEAEALVQVRKEVAWTIYKTKDYEMWSNEFNTAAERLIKSAKDKNLSPPSWRISN